MIRLLTVLLLILTLPVRAEDDARQQEAESSFDTIMLQNAARSGSYPAPAPATTTLGGNLGDGSEAVTPRPAPKTPEPPSEATVDVPLDRYEAVRARVAAADAEASRAYATLVVLGASEYSGRAVEGGLALHLTLQATLRGPGLWKAVPIVGEEVAVIRAKAGNSSVALTNQSGYQVWVTDQVGEVTLELDLLVPARGPRGSLEYDFLIARTPVTRFDCTFPEVGLEPRIQRSVRAEVRAEGNSTRLDAWLEPTSRIHLVGFKDLGEEDGRAARVYVETLSLLSVQESQADLFSVLRYSILQAGTRQFDIWIPPGHTVVSADGDGAFRYTVEGTADGTILHGETAFPIRDSYEVSVRLARTLDGGPVDVAPPHALGVEREHGWLGVEVLGALQLEEVARTEALTIDVAQLPDEVLGNAVSPVLKGWRYHTGAASVRLTATRLPEREPSSGSIDAIEAHTVIAAEGRARTELKITLRNRLRHSLRVRLPEGVEVRGCRLDGVAVTPSRSEDGALSLPLKRSQGDRPVPFSLELSLEGGASALGLLGIPTLELPALELPVSSVKWDVAVPAANDYTRLYGDIAAQGAPDEPWGSGGDLTTLRYTRYWLAGDQPVRVRFGYLKAWLRVPLALFGAFGLVLLAGRAWRAPTPTRRVYLGGAWLGALACVGWLGGVVPVGIAVIVTALVLGAGTWLASLVRTAWARLWARTDAEPREGSWRSRAFLGRVVLLGGAGIVSMMLFVAGLRFVWVLLHPLG